MEAEAEKLRKLEGERIQKAKLLDAKYEVEETIKRIGSHKGILGTIIANSDGIPLKSTMDSASTMQFASYMTPIALQSRDITRDVNPKDDVILLRVRTKVHEVIISPSQNHEYLLMIIQKTSNHLP